MEGGISMGRDRQGGQGKGWEESVLGGVTFEEWLAAGWAPGFLCLRKAPDAFLCSGRGLYYQQVTTSGAHCFPAGRESKLGASTPACPEHRAGCWDGERWWCTGGPWPHPLLRAIYRDLAIWEDASFCNRTCESVPALCHIWRQAERLDKGRGVVSSQPRSPEVSSQGISSTLGNSGCGGCESRLYSWRRLHDPELLWTSVPSPWVWGK